MSENQSRASVIPPFFGQYKLTIKNNDGTKELYTITYGMAMTVKVTDTGLDGGYTYDSDGEFLGFATSENQTSPTYTSGRTIDIPSTGLTLYIVSYEWDKTPIEYDTAKVEYNGVTLGAATKGSPLTLECANAIMKSNVTITKT